MRDDILWNCTEAEYHADTSAISQTMAKDFDESARMFAGRYVFGKAPALPDKECFRIGRMLNDALLQPEKFATSYIVAPNVDRRTKGGKAEWAFFLESLQPGQIAADPDEHELALRMSEAVMGHAQAAKLLGCDGPCESTVKWRHEATGLMLKARRDKVAPHVVLDLKSSRDPSPAAFKRAIVDYGYHRQGAWYVDSEHALTGTTPGFGLIVVRNEWPFEVALYEVTDDVLAYGRQQNENTLAAIARCHDTGDWRNEWEKQIQFVDPPQWMQRSLEVAE